MSATTPTKPTKRSADDAELDVQTPAGTTTPPPSPKKTKLDESPPPVPVLSRSKPLTIDTQAEPRTESDTDTGSDTSSDTESKSKHRNFTLTDPDTSSWSDEDELPEIKVQLEQAKEIWIFGSKYYQLPEFIQKGSNQVMNALRRVSRSIKHYYKNLNSK